MEALRECRAGRNPIKTMQGTLPTLAEALTRYCNDKRLKPTSRASYDSMIRIHFTPWKDQPVTALTGTAFSEHCHQFAKSNGAVIVEVGRGLMGAMIRYLNAVYPILVGVDMPQPKIELDNKQVENQEQDPLDEMMPAGTLDEFRQEMLERFPGTTSEDLEAMGC